jgi:hypothetical protein
MNVYMNFFERNELLIKDVEIKLVRYFSVHRNIRNITHKMDVVVTFQPHLLMNDYREIDKWLHCAYSQFMRKPNNVY